MSESASPAFDGQPEGGVRRWGLSGWKENGDPAKRYQAAFTFFHGWEGGRGPFDCEPLQRAFGPPGESFGTFASYSVGERWTIK
jgi:hypothetical protein